MRVLHIVADGDPGWAATAAMALIEATPAPRGVRHALVTETGSPLAASARARGIPTATRAFQRPRRMGALRPRLVETVWEIAPDLVHAHGLSAGFAVLPAVRWLDLPLVVSMPAVTAPRLGPWARLRRRLERRAVLRAASVLVFGTAAELAAARRARSIPATRAALVAPPPIDLAALPPRQAGANLIVLMGRVHEDFPVGVVVAALAASPPGTRLCVPGDGAGVPLLAEALAARGLAEHADWPGPMPRHAALELLASASVVVDPRPAPGVPIGLIEAAAMGVPVVTGARPALAEALGIEGLAEGCSDAAWAGAVAAAFTPGAAGAGAARQQVRAWLAAARPVEQHLRAWEIATESARAALAADASLPLPEALRRA